MSIHRILVLCCLAMCLMPLAASNGRAQVRIPTENTLEDMQLFAPVDSNAMSDRPYLKEGLFFGLEYLVWSVSRPEAATVGAPGETRIVTDANTFQQFVEENSLDTSEMEDLIHDGSRVQVGYIYDGCGWFAGYFKMHERHQRIAHNNAAVLFEDPMGIYGRGFLTNRRGFDADLDGDRVYGRDGEDLGTPLPPTGQLVPIGFVFPAPHPNPGQPAFEGAPGTVGRPEHPLGSLGDGVRPGFYLPYDAIPDSFPNGDIPDLGDLAFQPSDFQYVDYHNILDIWGLEANCLRRLDRICFGGHCELFAGVRFVSVDEIFHFEGEGGALGDTIVNNDANNNIIGPQIGARWFKSCCRWSFSTEARFAPSVNFQAVRMRSSIGSHNARVNQIINSLTVTGLSFQNAGNDTFHGYEFSPVAELRLGLSYQLTRAIALTAGWNAMYVGGVARPSNMIRWIVPNTEIIEGNNYDDLFMQGVNFGFEVNR